MLALQDAMNRAVDADWRERDRAWFRAIWIECAELMEHYAGWKWWRRAEPDLDQVMLEIVDIWHFGLSLHLGLEPDRDRAAATLAVQWRAPLPAANFHDAVEQLALCALRERRFLVGAVPVLLEYLNRDFDDLYRAYVGKNVLNIFRQDHGYRHGTYRKLWQGREDNEHLIEILRALDADDSGFQQAIYAALEQRYAADTGE
ncbi:MAG: dUTP diphosphatase [Gammaproteobacteria bacterium]|nr:dUTP diphosphatase [Gammaproteobacteria bacterium]